MIYHVGRIPEPAENLSGVSLGVSSNSTWNRQELYEKVWQFPLRKLAVEYGISDVGLAKVCRKLKIPLPGLGQWTRIACGDTIARPPLPVMENIPVLIRQIREAKVRAIVQLEAKDTEVSGWARTAWIVRRLPQRTTNNATIQEVMRRCSD
jgi:hypothetical protein